MPSARGHLSQFVEDTVIYRSELLPIVCHYIAHIFVPLPCIHLTLSAAIPLILASTTSLLCWLPAFRTLGIVQDRVYVERVVPLGEVSHLLLVRPSVSANVISRANSIIA